MTCQCDFLNIKEEDDDWEIQRLEDIITICEALIKHKKRQRNKMSVEELLAKLDKQTEKKKEKEEEPEKEQVNTTTIKYPKGWVYHYTYPYRLHRYPWIDDTFF